jgi:hypothetical protein
MEPDFPTVYRCGWVASGDVPLPAASARQMAAEDAQARRAGEEELARAQDSREAQALEARLTGRVRHGLGDVFAHALRQMSAEDFHAEQAEMRRNVTGYTGEPEPGPRKCWDDESIRAAAPAAAIRQLGREIDERRVAELAATDRVIAEAQARRPPSAKWPAWVPLP